MIFISELLRDYGRAYRIVRSQYKSLLLHFFVATLFMLVIAVISASAPYLLRQIIDKLGSDDKQVFLTSTLFLAGAYGLCWTLAQVGEWLKSIFSSVILAKCDAAFQKIYYMHLIRVEYETLIKIDHGHMVSIISRSRAAFSAITFTLFWIVTPTLLQLIFASAVIWHIIGIKFFLSFIASMIVLFFVTCWLAGKTKGAHAEIFGAANQLSSHLVEKLGFSLDIKLNNAYQKEEEIIDIILGRVVRKVSLGNRRLSLLMAAQALCTGILLTVFTIISVYDVLNGKIKIGDFIMLTGYIVALTVPFNSLAGSLSDLRRNHLAMKEGFEILELKKESDANSVAFVDSSDEAYVIDNVDLMVGDNKILQDVNFIAKRGEVTVICGSSGNGKSSLVNLMLGLIHPYRGKVFLNQICIEQLSIKKISTEVAAVPQDPLIISGSLRDNLSYGCTPPPSDSYLLTLVDLLELSNLCKSDSTGILDYHLGVQGNSLSGGEKQRVALGRALARMPSIIIMDEPTSSLDLQRETRIFEKIRHRVPTIIVVTHRQAIVEKADRIYEVDSGSVKLIRSME